MPGVLRAERRLRPRQRADAGRGSEDGAMGGHRAEGVDVPRAVGGLVLRPVPHRRRGSPAHRGLSYLLVPMRQPGIEIRPIVQLTGTSEFNEVFFDGRAHRPTNVVGEVNDGWRVAMGTLAFERGASTLGQQLGFENELAGVIVDGARDGGASDHRSIRQRLGAGVDRPAAACGATRCGPCSGRAADGSPGPEATISKLYWAHLAPRPRRARDGRARPGRSLARAGDELLQRLFLFTRADTIYGGSNQIQRNLIGERALGLPREPARDRRPSPYPPAHGLLDGQDRARHRRGRDRHRLRDRQAVRRGRGARRGQRRARAPAGRGGRGAVRGDRCPPARRRLRRHDGGGGAAPLRARRRRSSAASTCS